MNEPQSSSEPDVLAILALIVAIITFVATWIRAGQANQTAASSSNTAKSALKESKRANRTADKANKLAQHLHDDAGGRVIVEMNAAGYEVSTGAGILHRDLSGDFHLEEQRGPMVELCQIVIENPGRTGVTVTGASLRIEGTGTKYKTVGARSFSLQGFGAQDAVRVPFFRLEPYDRRTLLLDYWSVVDGEFDKNPSLQEITIYAEVTVAGHKNSFTSVAHGYWRIRRQQISAVGDHLLRRPRNILLAYLARRSFDDLAHLNSFDDFVVTVEETANLQWSSKELRAHLDYLLKTDDFRSLSRSLYHAGALSLFATNEFSRLKERVEPYPVPQIRAELHAKRQKEWNEKQRFS